MANVESVGKKVSDFLKRNLNVKDVKVVKVAAAENGWECEAEVYEESSFIKSLGLPTKTQDRNFYGVKLDAALEIVSYERIREGKGSE